MEKKTTRRIIGVLVVIALVIILLPLMFNGPENQSPIQTSEAKAPAFPGTEIEASAATENTNMIPPSQSGALINRIVAPSSQQQVQASAASAETIANTASQSLSQTAEQTAYGNTASPEGANMLSSESNAPMSAAAAAPMVRPINELTANNGAGDNVIVIDSDGDGSTTTLTKALAQADLSKSEMKVAPMQAEVAPTQARTTVLQAQPAPIQAAPEPVLTQASPAITQARPQVTKSIVSAITKTPNKVISTTKTTTTTTKQTTAAKADTNPSEKTIADLKKSASIVQLGSFKNKINAERLTNSLRAKGYKAFTLETKSNGQTRVCVGPEFKQMAAATLASKIQQDINMRGVVMAFQPLAL
jgi:cell division septation protein DedD